MQLNYSSQNVTALGAQGFKKIARGGGGSGFFPLCSRLLRSGPTTRPVSVLYTCARPQCPRTPCSAQRSTSGTCTRTWWCEWRAWCRTPARSTSPRSRPSRGTSCCTRDRPCPGSLGKEARAGQGVPSPSCSNASSPPAPQLLAAIRWGIYRLQRRPRVRLP